MDDLSDTAMPWPLPDKEKLVTSRLFEAYLACPTKCYLQSIGEVATGNDFAIWNETRSASYRLAGVQRLMADHPCNIDVGQRDPKHWKHALWHFLFDYVARTQHCEAPLHAVQRISSVEGRNHSSQFIPIRFVPTNKLARSDKLMAGFEALALSKALGIKVGIAKIIYGDKWATFKVRADTISRAVNKAIGQVAALLSAPFPPDLILNRHCPECVFQSRCRKKTVEKDDLSLLANMTAKERARFNRKGIFTVSQLSYTFRPRRRIKRLAAKREKYHHSLKALAIRERKIHVVGDPQLNINGTAIYFDVEGLPDREFYYLIGVRLEGDQGIAHHNLWANKAEDEKCIWNSFLDILSGVDRPVLIHYGNFETTFLKRMRDRYGGPPEDSAAAKAISSSVNLLTVIFAQVYFPTYSNSLKDIAQHLGFEWSASFATGLQSIAWRHEWEASADTTVREKLIAYNTDDCKAVCLVVRTLSQIGTAHSTGSEYEIIRVESLGKNPTSKWRTFKSVVADLELINNAAHWNYQRDHVFVRSGAAKRRTTKLIRSRRPVRKAEISVVLKPPTSCPKCGKRRRRKARLFSRTVQDLVFSRGGVKGRFVHYVFQTYNCRTCGHAYNIHEWYLHGRKWGWNVVAYFVYHIVGLRIPQRTLLQSMNRLYGCNLARSTMNEFKTGASEYYSVTKRQILDRIVNGNLIHADETRANIKGHLAYVWVLANLNEVAYILVESRE
jgi:predicted RecB family nuclease